MKSSLEEDAATKLWADEMAGGGAEWGHMDDEMDDMERTLVDAKRQMKRD